MLKSQFAPWKESPKSKLLKRSRGPGRACKSLESWCSLGFTLLEVLLALALLAVLLGAVLQAMRWHARLNTLGQSSTEQWRLLWALQRQFRQDLHTLVLPYSSQSASSEDRQELLFGTSPTELSVSDQLVLEGTAESLTLCTQLTSDQVSSVWSSEQEGANWAGSQMVAYFLVQSNQANLWSPVAQVLGDSQGTQGLVRLQGPALQVQEALELGNWELLAQWAQLIAPEVASIQFRYFDGQQWWDTWSAQEQGSLPLLVEITLELHSSQSSEAEAAPSTSHQVLVAPALLLQETSPSQQQP